MEEEGKISTQKPKKKTIQFEEEPDIKKPEEKRVIISPTQEKGGILKKKNSPEPHYSIPDNEDEEDETQKPENEEEEVQKPENKEDVYSPGKIPLLNLNFDEVENKKKKFPKDQKQKSKPKQLKLKKNTDIKAISEGTSEKFEKLNEGLEMLRKEQKIEDLNENKMKKLRVPQDADYIEENIYKALREGVDEMFLKKPKNPIKFLGVFLMEYQK